MDEPVAVQVKEEPCMEVRLEYQSPPLCFRAPLPYVAVTTQAARYHRATVVDISETDSELDLATSPETELAIDLHKSTRRRFSTECDLWGLSARGHKFEPRMSLNEDSIHDGSRHSSEGRKALLNGIRDSVKGNGDLNSPRQEEAIIQGVEGKTCPGGETKLFIWEKGDQIPYSSQKDTPVKKDNPVNVSTELGNRSLQDQERKMESRNVLKKDSTSSSGLDGEDLLESNVCRIRHRWIMPMERDFRWNKPVNSINRMISNFENLDDTRKINSVPKTTNTSFRLTKTSRVPVSTLAERFTRAANGSKE
ncbi:uncharacterized protein [Hetaerina americana]|uniref:uncharacterized protein n=1 Tax=Hetaerina americana TaxID=62018 RepID=UPI003A7F2E64